MTENVDPVIERIEVNAVGLRRADINGLDELHGFRVEHRWRPAAGEPMTGFRIDGRSIAANAGYLTDGLQRLEVEDRETRRDGRTCGAGCGAAARNV